MPSKLINSVINRRMSYSVYARAVKIVHAPTAVGPRAESAAPAAADGGRATNKEEVFWMRDPKTGCWIPENRLVQDNDVDAVELRNRLMSNGRKT